MKSEIIALACETEIYRDASIEYRMASDAAEDGDFGEANDHLDEGEQILNQRC